jgi:undecaprenyl-diphosphatase
MNDFLSAIILGIVEGITEFLPVSSTGHLILVNQVIEFTGTFANQFDVIIQLGAILSVIAYFWKRLSPFGKMEPARRSGIFDNWFKAIVGVIPALLLGFLLGDFIEEKLFNPVVVAITLVLGGILLIYIESKHSIPRITSVAELKYSTILWIGLIQCLAMVPGTSRSAATIIGAMLLGSSRLVAAEFSFFLAIPTMVAASGYTLLKAGFDMSSQQLMVLTTGFVVSFFTAWLVIAAFMKFISRHDFKGFGIYRIILGAAVLGYFILHGF